MCSASPLQIVKLTELTRKQLNLFGEMAVYFHHRFERAKRKQAIRANPEVYLEPIPLSQIHNLYKCTNNKEKQIVKVAANIFFTNVFRGNNKNAICSRWKLKESPHVNQGVLKMLSTLFVQNSSHIDSVEGYLNAKDKSNAVVTTVFKFESEQQAQVFVDLINSASSSAVLKDDDKEEKSELFASDISDLKLKQKKSTKLSELTVPPDGLDKKQLSRWIAYVDKTSSFRNWKCRMKSLGMAVADYDFVLKGYKIAS